MFRRQFLSLGAATLLAFASTSWAGTALAQTEPRAFIEKMHRDLFAAIGASKDPKNDPKLLLIFDQTLDYEYLTRETLGEHAAALTPEQRAQYDQVLRELVRTSYRKNLRDPSGYAIEYTGQSPADGATLVQTVTASKRDKREKPMPVDYLVAKRGDAYLVQDVVTSGVSLVRNYRRQFGRIIKRKGFDALMKLMNDRLAELRQGVTN